MLKTTTLGLSALVLSAATVGSHACNSVGNFTTTHNNQLNNWSELTYANGRLTLVGGSSWQLSQSLKMATDTGRPLTIEGTYNVNTTRTVQLRNRLSVTATNATFVGTSSLDGDLFAFKADGTSNSCANDTDNQRFIWNGGKIDMSAAKVSTVIPGNERLGGNAQGTSSTADGISVRAHSGGQIHVDNITIRNVEFYGTKHRGQDYRYAGGDSAFLLSGPGSTDIENNDFYGVRDAAVYISADNDNGTLGDHFRAKLNYVEHAYDGITSKRGADNLNFSDNTIKDTVVGISTKLGRSTLRWVATNVKVHDNDFTRVIRGISLEFANNIDLQDNNFYSFGAAIQNTHDNVIVSASKNSRESGVYEGISLNGTQGTNKIENNSFNGTGSAPRYPLVYRTYKDRSTTGVDYLAFSTSKGNSFSNVSHGSTSGNTKIYAWQGTTRN